MKLKQLETSFKEVEVANEIAENANGEIIDVEPEYTVDDEPPQADNVQHGSELEQQPPIDDGQQQLGGPGF
jgi:hypothetical protein